MAIYRLLDDETKGVIIEDIRRCVGPAEMAGAAFDPGAELRNLMLSDDVFRSLFYYRCRKACIGTLRGMLFLKRCKNLLPGNPGIYIASSSVGAGLRIFHASLVIGKDVVVGKNVSVTANVVIGKRHGKSPVIRDGVMIGANATVIGGIEVGENATVGAGSVVVKDVPAGAVVAGNPAHTIH